MGDEIEIRPLDKLHDLAGFECGVERIDNYLTKTAWREHKTHKIRVFAATLPGSQVVVGYYSLTFIVWTDESIGEKVRTKFVSSGAAVPAIYLPKIGVRETHAKTGIGSALVKNAFERSLLIADNAAIGTLTLDAIDPAKAVWYASLGFVPFAEGDLKMVISLNNLRKAA